MTQQDLGRKYDLWVLLNCVQGNDPNEIQNRRNYVYSRVGQGHVFFGGSVMRFMMRFWLWENDSKQLKMNT